MKSSFTSLLLVIATLQAADLPPDKGNVIPESAKRPVVLTGKAAMEAPKADLPAGYTLSVAAASPLVLHPIMGCLDDRGRLFIGDGTGVNWNKAQLEANPPNRVLMLEDTDSDGAFDKSTIFADKMTFPQGAAWLGGSLYVCSPPGLWRLTDTDGDGVADKREMIVSGFEYTGNAADVHGPFLHPNGRLYWCHGRKGHKATDRDGKVVHEGLACGIWSCDPEGRDLQWHSLGCGDNPVEVDFTPDGDIVGVQNLYYTNPRGDTLVHWLYGGVYERSDQLKAIDGLPRTLEHMPVMYNFGHVAVSGSCFWHNSNVQARDPKTLQFMVTHFNTQRVVRMELTPEGSTYKATENEFLKLHSPDIHFTDVMEDSKDGSLLVVDTGGWFRIGCPSSLMAKPDIAGAIYRIKGPSAAKVKLAKAKPMPTASSQIAAMLTCNDPFFQRRACDAVCQMKKVDAEIRGTLVELLGGDLDPSLEHAAIHAAIAVKLDLSPAAMMSSSVLRRYLRVASQLKPEDRTKGHEQLLASAAPLIDDPATDALTLLLQSDNADDTVGKQIAGWAASKAISDEQLNAMAIAGAKLAGKPNANLAISRMLSHEHASVRNRGLGILGALTPIAPDEAWLPALDSIVAAGASQSALDAIKHLKTDHFDAKLQVIANDAKQPQSLRLKALDAMSTRKITGETFTMVLDVLTNPASSAAAKIQASDMMAHSGHTKDERLLLAKAFATVGPVELKELLVLLRAAKEEDVLRAMATELAKNPALISQQESIYRTALADKPTDIFENIIRPAYVKAYDAIDAKKRTLAPLSEKVASHGDAVAGKQVFESGRGTCIACHQIGDKGRSIGPNLSKIGSIRTERDILESILFPSNTLARDYEAHVIEMIGGESVTGVIKSHTAEGLLVVDVGGVEHSVPQAKMVSDTTLTVSLMPMGLDMTLPEQDLLNLVAYLRSLK